MNASGFNTAKTALSVLINLIIDKPDKQCSSQRLRISPIDNSIEFVYNNIYFGFL
jgi:hypothetical protein